MGNTILKLENLSVSYNTASYNIKAVDGVSLSLKKGDSIGIIGESGSGKTTLAMCIMRLLDKSAASSGSICFDNTDLQSLSEEQLNKYRWRRISILFQNSLDVLNPVLTVYEQISECMKQHMELSSKEIKKKVADLIETAGLEPSCQMCYPHQLSGGMRQRVLLAMALSCDPEVLIVDEPTNALDAVSKNEIIELLLKLHRERKFTMIVISHEFNTVSRLSSRLAVMYKGYIVEEGLTGDILNHPMHNYTRGLLNSSPEINPYRDLWGIPDEPMNTVPDGCPFYARCNQHVEMCRSNKPELEYVSIQRRVACNRGGIVTLLKGTGINKFFRFKGTEVKACNECSMKVCSGEIAALIGESGSGKTTLASILAGILQADAGEISFMGDKISGNSATRKKNGIQMVFQDPFSSVNENFTIEDAAKEPLDILGLEPNAKRKELVIKALRDVQLPWDKSFLERRCHTLSGGQRQRLALTRALVMEPSLLIADEISSMLDPSTQANILRLLKGLQNSKGFAMLYITHDLAIAQKIADRVYVMHNGRIIEKGNTRDVFSNPVQSYTKRLVSCQP